MKRYEVFCNVCKKRFIASRSDAKCCSSSCRVRRSDKVRTAKAVYRKYSKRLTQIHKQTYVEMVSALGPGSLEYKKDIAPILKAEKRRLRKECEEACGGF